MKKYKACERPAQFDVRTLFPAMSDLEVAEELAKHFNEISSEFEPLEPKDIPSTKDRQLPILAPHEVAGRIRAFKKPKSMVRGDIFPALFSCYGDLLAIPLCDIFNTIARTRAVSYTHLTLPTIYSV